MVCDGGSRLRPPRYLCKRRQTEGTVMEPVTVSIADACKATGLGRNSIYNLINSQVLTTVRIGRRQLVRVDSIKKLVGAA